MALLQQQDAAAMSKSCASVIWKNSSRGKVSRMSTSALPLCAVRIEAGAFDGARRFEAQHRDLAHAAAVGGGGEEAEEAILADQIAVVVVALDADAVDRHRRDGRCCGCWPW